MTILRRYVSIGLLPSIALGAISAIPAYHLEMMFVVCPLFLVAVIEETCKYLLFRYTDRSMASAFLVGFGFSLMENILFISYNPSLQYAISRFGFPVLVHTICTLFFAYGMENKEYKYPVISVAIHWIYDLY